MYMNFAFLQVSNIDLIFLQMVCSQSSEFRCSKDCGNPLACGNHFCRNTCHFVTIPRLVAGEEVFQLDKLPIPAGLELAEPTEAPEGVWGKYGAPYLMIIVPVLARQKTLQTNLITSKQANLITSKLSTVVNSVAYPAKRFVVFVLCLYLHYAILRLDLWLLFLDGAVLFCDMLDVCLQKRVLPCPHPCTQRCHIGSCKPCKATLKRACHCEALVKSFECTAFNSVNKEARAKLLSCGGPCHRYFHHSSSSFLCDLVTGVLFENLYLVAG